MGVKDVAFKALGVFTSPAKPQDYLRLINPLTSARQLRGVVMEVTPETANSATIRFRPGPEWSAHEAGQWARIGVEIDGVRQWRSYSLSTAEGQDPAITVTAVGRVSSHLVRETKPGDVLFLAPPQGDFVLPTGPRPLLMLTGGSGITPVMSMIRTLLPNRSDADVVLIHSARTREDMLFADELALLEEKYPGFTVLTRSTRDEGRISFADTGDLDRLCPDWRSRKAFVCGPAQMLDDAEALWARDHAPDALAIERFTTATLAARDSDGGVVTFERSDKEAEAKPGQAILEAGEEAGVIMPSGCRMGICRTCLTPLLSGQVRDMRTGEIIADEGELIQTCVTTAVGPVHLDN